MANEFIDSTQVVSQALGVLERDTVLANLVWKDVPGDFRGRTNDTISLRLPAYTTARTRTLRAASGITIDELDETKVDVTLDTHVYKAIRVTDEEMTLDISDFGAQVTGPAISSVGREIDESLAAEMEGATYAVEVPLTEADPYLGLVDARIALNNANVPASMRFLAVGSSVEAAILKSDRLSKFDNSGSDSALRESTIGRIAGMTAVSVPGLDPHTAIAAHKTAFTLSLVAPIVPDGASWGTRQTYNGMSLRVLRDYLPDDTAGPSDRLLADTFMGTGVVGDRGTIGTSGRFNPTVDGTDAAIFVRAVKLNLPLS